MGVSNLTGNLHIEYGGVQLNRELAYRIWGVQLNREPAYRIFGVSNLR